MGLVTTGHCWQEAKRFLSAVARGFHANRRTDMFCQGRKGIYSMPRSRIRAALPRRSRR
jgi:hypothetical protein